jgi:hypothetical protein
MAQRGDMSSQICHPDAKFLDFINFNGAGATWLLDLQVGVIEDGITNQLISPSCAAQGQGLLVFVLGMTVRR